MGDEAVNHEANDQDDRQVQDLLGVVGREALHPAGRMQVGEYGEDTRQYCDRRNRVSKSVVLVHTLVNHRVKNQANDRDNQEHVLREEHDGFALHQ